ncbi:MAG TPA: PAS domain S-box protein [Candidatus Paceibacterota bacterium]|nr:PAS domain S-box protein [Candidatus Paceibacterota bacterium]
MQPQKVIEQLGYTAKEAKVYLAVLSLGECHVSDVAHKVKMPRTSVQLALDKLLKDGLVTFYVMRRYKYWVAENPDRILANMKRLEETMKETLPRLNALKKENRLRKQTADPAQSLGLFRMLADASTQPVIITNEQVEIEYVNAVWEEQFGYSLEEVRGENPRILKSGQTPVETYKEMFAALKAGKMFQTDKIIDKRKNGTLFNLLTTVFPVCHNGSIFYIQMLDDITEKKRVESFRKKFADL